MKDSRPHQNISIHTLGCRLNQFESQGLENLLEESTSESGEDRLHIINTCSVTEQADARCRNLIRSIHRKDPDAKIIVTGCYAQESPESLKDLPGVFRVIGNDLKSSIPELLAGRPPRTEEISHLKVKRKREGRELPLIHRPFHYGTTRTKSRVRSIVKIQEGCNRRCSYCRVPYSRGGARSRPFSEVIEHVRELDRAGVPEIILTGVNTADWREDGLDFWDLAETILNSLTQSRLRFSSLEPASLGKRAGKLFQHPLLCRFLHVPLQSGSNEILQRMRRGYTRETYLRKIRETLDESGPLFLGTDVMVGFPEETEGDFQDTLDLLHGIGFQKIHSFRFSPRAGTPAAEWKGRPSGEILDDRMKRLQELEEHYRRVYLEKRIGTVGKGIIEKTVRNGSPGKAVLDDSMVVRFTTPFAGEQKGGVQDFLLQSIDPSLTFMTGVPL